MNSAYVLADRFPWKNPCQPFTIGPGTYDFQETKTPTQSKAPFLSTSPRVTLEGQRLYTEVIYLPKEKRFIPGGGPWKRGREPKEESYICSCEDGGILPICGFDRVENKKGEEQPLCICEEPTSTQQNIIEKVVGELKTKRSAILKHTDGNVCTCDDTTELQTDTICQKMVERKLMKGHTKVIVNDGVCQPEIDLPEKTLENVAPKKFVSPGTKKLGKWVYKPMNYKSEKQTTPGPADYNPYDIEISDDKKCQAEFVAERRRTSKQPRYLEIVQRQNILHGGPAPCDYFPKEIEYYTMRSLGPKAPRFVYTDKGDPGPGYYSIKRDFDPHPNYRGRVPPACAPPDVSFGGAKRWCYKMAQQPGPQAYDVKLPTCKNTQHCELAPFNTTAVRFKDAETEDEDSDEDNCCICKAQPCILPTSAFMDRSIRFPPHKEIQMKDISKSNRKPKVKPKSLIRDLKIQKLSPFNTSEGRFQPFNNYIATKGLTGTKGPGAYELATESTPKYGALDMAPRFSKPGNSNPAPNSYRIRGGVDDVLETFNHRLRGQICSALLSMPNTWKGIPKEKPCIEVRERKFLDYVIKTLDFALPENYEDTSDTVILQHARKIKDKNKLMKYFLYKYPTKRC